MEAMAFFSVCDLVSNTNIWTQGERGEKGLIVNPQQEPNKEELSKYLPFCYILLKREGKSCLSSPSHGPDPGAWASGRTSSLCVYNNLVR